MATKSVSASPQIPNAAGVAQTFLSKRVQAIITNDKLFDNISSDAVTELSHIVKGSSDGYARKNLKSALESRLLELHVKFVDEYDSEASLYIAKKLADMERLELQLGESVDKLSVNRERIGTVIERSSQASSELAEVERKLALLSRFRELFFVEDARARTPTSTLVELLSFVDDIHQKRERCQILLQAVPNAAIAIESLTKAVQQLESVYDRVYFTLLRDEQHVSLENLRKALILLQERPHLFHETLSSVARARCDRRSAEFLQVLNGLELNSFDSARLLSDMLSGLLDAALEERDWLAAATEGARALTWQTPPVASPTDYIDLTLLGVGEMIDSRFASIVQSSFGVLDLFKLANIVAFYERKCRGVTGSATAHALADMHRRAWGAFLAQWERRGQQERSSALLQVAAGLGPLPSVAETVFQLEQILTIHSELGAEDDEELFSVVSAGIDPLIQLCVQTAAGLSKTESAVFLLNCLAALRAPVQRFSFTAGIAKNIQTLIDDQMHTLVGEATAAVLHKTGLGGKLEEIRKLKSENKSIETSSELHPIALSSAVKSFYSMLFTQGVSAASHADSLTAKDLRARARQAVATAIADAYDEFYNSVQSMGVASHSPEQVRALLDL